MLLSDKDIRAAIEAGRLGIEPFEPELIQPSSVDVRIDKYFRVFNNSTATSGSSTTRSTPTSTLSVTCLI